MKLFALYGVEKVATLWGIDGALHWKGTSPNNFVLWKESIYKLLTLKVLKAMKTNDWHKAEGTKWTPAKERQVQSCKPGSRLSRLEAMVYCHIVPYHDVILRQVCCIPKPRACNLSGINLWQKPLKSGSWVIATQFPGCGSTNLSSLHLFYSTVSSSKFFVSACWSVTLSFQVDNHCESLWHFQKKTADFIKLSPRSENPSSCHLKRLWAHRSRRLCRMPTANKA